MRGGRVKAGGVGQVEGGRGRGLEMWEGGGGERRCGRG